MKRGIKAEERKLWLEVMRGVRRRIIASPEPETQFPAIGEVVSSPAEVSGKQVSRRGSEKTLAVPVPGIEGEISRRLKTKAARPQARLDLHGMTEKAAHATLITFIEKARAKNYHLVLVITGKGRSGEGVLRRNLPLWLESVTVRPHILGFAPAFTQDGGGGAYYIHLRRRAK